MPRPPIYPTESMVGFPTVAMANTQHPARLVHMHVRDALEKIQHVWELFQSQERAFMALAQSANLDFNVLAMIKNTEEVVGQLDDMWRLIAQQEYFAGGNESWTMAAASASALGGDTDVSWTLAMAESAAPVAVEPMLTYHTVPPSAVGTASDMGFPKWVRA
jgi:hypothetical protein